MSQGFNDSKETELVGISGYSFPGILEDCQIPVELYPLQYDGLTLREISQKLLSYFRITMVVDPSVSAEMDKAYEKTTAEPTQTIKEYLASLAGQRNIVITHNEKGHLVYTKAKTNRKPILDYNGEIPFTNMALDFGGQDMHSTITVIKQADSKGGNAGEATVTNPFVPFVRRPRVATQSSGDDNDTLEVAKNILADELRGLKLTITSDRWDVNGVIVKPNNLITVKNPRIYLYKKATWFIEQVDYKGDEKNQTLTMTCCLPEVYSAAEPTYLFKGINMH